MSSTTKKEVYKSKVYLDRPPYADFDAPNKFEAIKGIIARKLYTYPNAICAYSGGSDSDIMLDLIEEVRDMFKLPPVHYCFFNTGLEMEAIKRHVKEVEKKYGVTITEHRPEKNVVQATRKYGLPFISKIMSAGLEGVQKKNIPLSIAEEYAGAEDKFAKRAELRERFPKCESTINFLCGCNTAGEPRPDIQLVIGSSKYLLDFIKENPIPFRVSNRCCNYCKKNLAHSV
ncbi:MAG: phosphoadenosine phosphosulfate reductase family protein, partial [Ruthenibacterium sp.]